MNRKITVYRLSFIVYRFLIAAVLFSIFAGNCYAAVWSSNELIEKAKELNGRKLSYRGELITAIMDRGDHSWVNLKDGSNAIGVWCKTSSLAGVKFIGDYKNRGDLLEVSGTFNRACSIHNGDLDIHADTVRIIRCGYPIDRDIDMKMVHSTAILFMIAIFTVMIFRKKL